MNDGIAFTFVVTFGLTILSCYLIPVLTGRIPCPLLEPFYKDKDLEKLKK